MEKSKSENSTKDLHGSSVQEWNGSEWAIVEDNTMEEGRAVPLDPRATPGEFAGQRVVVPGQPIKRQ